MHLLNFSDEFDDVCSSASSSSPAIESDLDRRIHCDITGTPTTPHIRLANGVQMPLLGLGTTHSGGYYHDTVVYALRHCKYRMIDTAKRYGVERELGMAVKDSGVPRSNLFLSTKLWPVDFGSNVRNAFWRSCEKLQSDYLDLYMVHFPVVPDWYQNPKEVMEETWRQMEILYDQGVLRSIGVSNYSTSDLEELMDYCSVRPHVNQCEFHPMYDPKELRDFCNEKGILFTGYCPLGKGRILNDSTIQAIAKKHGKTAAQICIRWSIENGVAAIPKSKSKSRVAENSEVFDFSLSSEDRIWLSKLSEEKAQKIIEIDERKILKKISLPDGYKLEGRVFGVPSRPSQLDSCNDHSQGETRRIRAFSCGFPNSTVF